MPKTEVKSEKLVGELVEMKIVLQSFCLLSILSTVVIGVGAYLYPTHRLFASILLAVSLLIALLAIACACAGCTQALFISMMRAGVVKKDPTP